MSSLEYVDEADPEVQFYVSAADKEASSIPSNEEIFDSYYSNTSWFSHDYQYRLEQTEEDEEDEGSPLGFIAFPSLSAHSRALRSSSSLPENAPEWHQDTPDDAAVSHESPNALIKGVINHIITPYKSTSSNPSSSPYKAAGSRSVFREGPEDRVPGRQLPPDTRPPPSYFHRVKPPRIDFGGSSFSTPSSWNDGVPESPSRLAQHFLPSAPPAVSSSSSLFTASPMAMFAPPAPPVPAPAPKAIPSYTAYNVPQMNGQMNRNMAQAQGYMAPSYAPSYAYPPSYYASYPPSMSRYLSASGPAPEKYSAQPTFSVSSAPFQPRNVESQPSQPSQSSHVSHPPPPAPLQTRLMVNLPEQSSRPPSPIPEKVQATMRAQLQWSPVTKQAYKDFLSQYQERAKEGFRAAKTFAAQHFQALPQKAHWKLYLEVADLAKRENKVREAAEYYEIATRLQPYAAKGWLEWAKMEEECGNLEATTRIITDGLYFCPQNENLLVKGIKHAEKVNQLDLCRILLGRLKDVAMERSWRTILEGALLEARQGKVQVARQIFKYLIQHAPSSGPVYTEAVQFELRLEEYSRAKKLVQLGLERIPASGPLWFLALQVAELRGDDYCAVVEQALPHTAKELVWKLYFELAQIEDRKGALDKARESYVKAVLSCPSSSLVWKIWLGGARTEMRFGHVDKARKLLLRAHAVAPDKSRALVLIECARFEEYVGHVDEARHILRKARKETPSEWKVFLEAASLEMRHGHLLDALKDVQAALDVHPSTGRLWAAFVQLTHLVNVQRAQKDGGYDFQLQTAAMLEALRHVPKSGEVWCEGARVAIHGAQYGLARKYLDFAIQFTPQYGDSFVELLRLEFLELLSQGKPLSSFSSDQFLAVERQCTNSESTYGACWTYLKSSSASNEGAGKLLRNARDQLLRLSQLREQASPANRSPVLEELDLMSAFLCQDGPLMNMPDPDFRFKAIFV